MKIKNVNELFAPIIYYKLLEVPSYETQSHYNCSFVNERICKEGDSNGSNSSYGPVLTLIFGCLIHYNVRHFSTCTLQAYAVLLHFSWLHFICRMCCFSSELCPTCIDDPYGVVRASQWISVKCEKAADIERALFLPEWYFCPAGLHVTAFEISRVLFYYLYLTSISQKVAFLILWSRSSST
jgi:hypothetical protein